MPLKFQFLAGEVPSTAGGRTYFVREVSTDVQVTRS